jgi:phosphonate transport system substrate-binding protein
MTPPATISEAMRQLVSACAFLFCVAQSTVPVAAADGDHPEAADATLQPAPLHVGFTRSSFRNVNPNDAEAAFRVFAQTVARQEGYQLDTSTRLFERAADCEAEVRKGGLTLIVTDALEYLTMDIPTMEPAFVHFEQGVVLKDCLLLTRRASGPGMLADLRGKDIVVLSSKSGNVSLVWLKVLLFENGLGPPEAFFKTVETGTKPSATILPVFFGNKAACLVDRLSFKTMIELNPQVGATLAPIAVSDLYLDSVTCITRVGYPSDRAREDFRRQLRELHLKPAGRQILTMFKVDRLVPFKEEYLDGVRRLLAKSDQVKISDPAQAPGPAAARSPAGGPPPPAKTIPNH